MRKIIYIATVLAMLLNVSCEKLPDFNLLKKKSLQEKFSKKMPELQEMSELGCVEYTVTKVITPEKDDAEDNNKIFGKSIGHRNICYNCVAYIKAGIDMKKFDASKIIIDEKSKSIVLTLPKPEKLSFDMPNDKIKVVYEKKKGLISKYSNDRRHEIQKKGQDEIDNEDALKELGIYDDARKNADRFFRNLLKGLGFEIITIKFEGDEKSN